MADLQHDADHIFKHGDIGDRELVNSLLSQFRPEAVIHFAAESHVDRSIRSPETFIETNVVGTFRLLDEVRHYWEGLPTKEKQDFRFLQISTDEVYGSLGPDDPAFTETTPYTPNSPYSASKAAAIIWCEPTTRRTACRYCSPIVPITMGRCNFRKNLSRC